MVVGSLAIETDVGDPRRDGIRLAPGSVLARIGHTRADAQGRLLVDKGATC